MPEEKEIKKELIEQLKKEGNITGDVREGDSLLLWGISSITVMKVLSQWAKKGYKVPFSELIRNPYIDQWAEIFSKSYQGNEKEKVNVPMENMYEPFDLTDVQYAYWIGRDRNQKLGGVGCHGYFEVDCKDLDLEKLERAWEVLFEYHPMLRAAYTSDGKQRILKEAFHKNVELIALDTLSEEEREQELLRIREERSHRLLDIENGEVISLVVTNWNKNEYRMHFEIDLLVCDVQSFGIILNDLAAYYLRKEKPNVEKEWNFAHYLKEHQKKTREEADKARTYWIERADELSDGPKLPLKGKQNTIDQLKFHRHSVDISEEEAAILAKKGSDYGATLAVVLLTAYGLVISKWSDQKKFLMNMPMFNREDETIQNVVADFTNLLLVELDYSQRMSFSGYLQAVQKSFLESMDHSACSGVEILRELRKQKGEDVDATIVFSCNLGTPLVSQDFKCAFHDIGYMISQTPQVLIDFQAFTATEGLQFIWDAADDMFPEGMVEEIFQCFVGLIHTLSERDADWNQMMEIASDSQLMHRNNAISFFTNVDRKRNMLEDMFRNAETYPDQVALIQPGEETITYAEMVKRVKCVAAALQAIGVKKGDYVAVLMPRGIRCVISEIAVIAAGAAYVPISVEQPELRRNTIIETAGCKAVIAVEAVELPKAITLVDYQCAASTDQTFHAVSIDPEDSAYVIFTSGSTGNPKGVEIAHGAAMNTIDDVNERYEVGNRDIGIGVSSNDFDLSVYDIFGMLSAGGSLVLITNEKKRDSATWLSYIRQYGVTVWNSVPTLMKMVLIEAENQEVILDTLRLAILSGDWIGLDIPDRMKHFAPNAHLAAMGGATEASIWSNVFDVNEDIPAGWDSIPYGTPLKNQFYRVVGEDGMDCPDEVIGELWIGGAGVAKGYVGDEQLTSVKFVNELGQRWYRTGDNGKFWRNGIIEFIGRRDHQIKLRGHRIELGEIENALNSCEGIQQSVALLYENDGNRQLCAFVTGENMLDGSELSVFEDDMLDHLVLEQYDFQKEADMETVMAKVTKETITALMGTLPDLENLPVERKYRELYKGWKALEQNQESIHVPAQYEAEETLLKQFVKPFVSGAADIILNKANPNELLLTKEYISPNTLAGNMPRGVYLMQAISQVIQKGAKRCADGINVLEIGARDLNTSAAWIDAAGKGQYTFLDKSLFFINAAKERFASKENVAYLISDLNEGMEQIQEKYDLVILNDTLHQFKNIDDVLVGLMEKVKANGLLLITEMVKEMPLQNLTSAFLLTDDYTDIRQNTKSPLLSIPQWQALFAEHDLVVKNILPEKSECLVNASQTMFALTKPVKGAVLFEESAVKDALSERVPEYMIPTKIKCLDAFPLTANGKVNRREMIRQNENWLAAEKKERLELPETETEERMCQVWQNVLGRAAGRRDNYFRLGGDSLLATILVGKIKEAFHVAFPLEHIFQYPVLCDMSAQVDQLCNAEGKIEDFKLTLIKDEENLYEPFPLTDVQQAYWIGRGEAFNYSDVTTHCYFEMDCEGFDLNRAEQVWNGMIAAHGMLRAVILKDGEHQQILEKVAHYQIKTYDAISDRTILDELREEMSQEQIDIYTWPLFDIRAARLEGGKSRLFISFDNIVLDGFSMFYLFREWKDLVSNEGKAPVPEQVSFRDYVISYHALKHTKKYNEDLEYWTKKLPKISPTPEFSMFANNSGEAKRFQRLRYRLSKQKWALIEEHLKEASLTPAVFLMGTYAETLGRWCATPSFSINLTRFNRMKFSETIDATVGDYTSLTIHSIDLKNGQTIEERLQNIQKNLWKDLNHPLISGIEVERMLNREYGTGTMPVVFTCGLGLTNGQKENRNPYPGKIIYGNSQTPQVWLDYQVYEDEGALELSWDALIDVFPEHMVEDMFAAYIRLLEKMADQKQCWSACTPSLVDIGDEEQRGSINDTQKEFPKETLTSLFLKAADRYSCNVAVIDERRSVTYAQLLKDASRVAKALVAEGVGNQDIVAVCLEKGWEQIVSILGILLAGGVYLPLNYKAPEERNQKIIGLSGAVKQINAHHFTELYTCETNAGLPETPAKPEDLAYIIYTSGTTGEPKGVAIEHGGAVNTILDVNERLQIGADDKTIAISDLSFDLSVYDIFGMLSAGGAVVFIKQGMDAEPSEWKRIVEKYQITTWNTVPMFMQMFTQYLKVHPFEERVSLKNILMSGDWIPLSLYEDIKETIGAVEIYSLGGATEASIWSNIYPIKGIEAHWRSIPYGKPLSNQRYYILNEQRLDCPYDVIGDLYIAGDGLAREYWNNETETNRAFIMDAGKGQRLYKTGDKALLMRDGNIEFCGRRDGQVKIAGFRIELGEINHAICAHETVRHAESIVKDGEIFTFIVWADGGKDETEEMKKISEKLKKELPHYMIPTVIRSIQKIPFTQNGKVDRKKLYALAVKEEKTVKTEEDRSLWTDMEQEIAVIWENILKTENFTREDNFIQLGGNSLAAVQLVNQISQKYQVEFMISDFYENATVAKLAQFITDATEEEENGEL